MTSRQRILVLGAGCVATACLVLWAAARKPAASPVPTMPPASAASPATNPIELPTEPEESAPIRIRFSFAGPAAESGIPAEWSPTVSAGKLQSRIVTPDEKQSGDASRHEKSIEDASALWMRSERASFLLTNRREFDVAEYPVLRWSWQATVLPIGGDVRKNAIFFGENLNDQAIQLLMVFEGQKVLSFVWDSTAPVGTEVDEPSPLATVKTRVVDSGNEHVGTWRHHEINVQEEYSRRFGKAPGKAVGVIVQSNSNHTQSIGEGLIREITVSAE